MDLKTLGLAVLACAALIYLNNRYRLPVLGLTETELADMAKRAQARTAGQEAA